MPCRLDGLRVSLSCCSDGYMNPNIHSARDVISNLNFAHGVEFIKMALAYLVELGNSVA